MKDYNTVVFSRGPVRATTDLVRVRARAITLLQRLYGLAKAVDAKHSVLGALNEATQKPETMKGGQKLEDAIKQNTEEIIRFYTGIVEAAENETLRTCK
jgi:rubrerythrin